MNILVGKHESGMITDKPVAWRGSLGRNEAKKVADNMKLRGCY